MKRIGRKALDQNPLDKKVLEEKTDNSSVFRTTDGIFSSMFLPCGLMPYIMYHGYIMIHIFKTYMFPITYYVHIFHTVLRCCFDQNYYPYIQTRRQPINKNEIVQLYTVCIYYKLDK